MAKKVDQRGMPLKTYDSHKRVASTSFAAVLLIIVGVFHLLQGFGALLSDADFTTSKGYALGSDGSKWGWAHLALGVAAIALGLDLPLDPLDDALEDAAHRSARRAAGV